MNLAPYRTCSESLVIGGTEPQRNVRRAEDPILLEQVVNDRLLLPVEPAGALAG